jgi:hypothetical protein
MMWLPPCTEANESHGVLTKNLIVKTMSDLREDIYSEDPLTVGNVPIELLNRELSLCVVILERGFNKE